MLAPALFLTLGKVNCHRHLGEGAPQTDTFFWGGEVTNFLGGGFKSDGVDDLSFGARDGTSEEQAGDATEFVQPSCVSPWINPKRQRKSLHIHRNHAFGRCGRHEHWTRRAVLHKQKGFANRPRQLATSELRKRKVKVKVENLPQDVGSTVSARWSDGGFQATKIFVMMS